MQRDTDGSHGREPQFTGNEEEKRHKGLRSVLCRYRHRLWQGSLGRKDRMKGIWKAKGCVPSQMYFLSFKNVFLPVCVCVHARTCAHACM